MMAPEQSEQPSVDYLDFQDEEMNSACCLEGDVCHVFLNWHAAADLQLALFGLWTKFEDYEDIDINDHVPPSLATHCAVRVRVCTITVIRDEDVNRAEYADIGRIRYSPRFPGVPFVSRITFYLTRAEVRSAFLAVREMMEDRIRPGEAELFKNLVPHFVPNEEPIVRSSTC